jgi:hypothetical protein
LGKRPRGKPDKVGVFSAISPESKPANRTLKRLPAIPLKFSRAAFSFRALHIK